MNHTKRREPVTIPVAEVVVAVLKGVAISVLILLLLLFLGAITIHQGFFTQNHMEGMVLASSLIATLLGGLFTLSVVRNHKLLYGMLVGLLYFLLLLLFGFLCSPSTTFSNQGVEILFASLVGGGMGKIFSRKKKKSH